MGLESALAGLPTLRFSSLTRSSPTEVLGEALSSSPPTQPRFACRSSDHSFLKFGVTHVDVSPTIQYILSWR